MPENDLPQQAHVDRTYQNIDRLAAGELIGPELIEQRNADTHEHIEKTVREGIQPPAND